MQFTLNLFLVLPQKLFLLTLKRFRARRGNLSIILSVNFQVLEIKFKNCRNLKKNVFEKIHTFAASFNIKWKFIPPRSPHFGGIWESAIKSAKHHLVRIMGNSVYSFEVLSTILAR